MATPQELQNALMLKKTQGLTTEQAVNQSRVPVTATSQINQDRLAQNQASRQWQPLVQPITPEQTQQINTPVPSSQVIAGQNPSETRPLPTEQDLNNQLGWVIQPNGLNSVQPINAVSEMPATPKVDATPGITQDAFQQAKLESEKIKAQNDAVLSQNQQKSDLAKQEQERIATEANNQLANNEWAILNTLKTGGMIPEVVKSSPFYKSAQQTYNKLQQYSTYSTNELVTAMNQGSIVPWTNVYNEMMKDPAMKQKLTDAQVYRAWNPVNSTQIYENASSDIMSNNPTTANYLADWVITEDEYNQATNNTEVVAKAKEVEEKANKYNTLKAEYDSIEDEVNKQFPWSPFADSIIADRQKAKYKNLVLAKWEWETSTGTLTELKSQASTLFETNLKLAETRRAEQNQIAAEQRAVQRSKDALQYEADFNKKQAELALNDPATAIKSVMDEYKKLWIPFTSTVQSRLAEFKASGKPLDQFLTEMWQNIQQSPAYKQYEAQQKGKWISYTTIGDKVYRQNADWSLTETAMNPNKAPDAKAPEWKQDASGNWYNANSATSPAVQASTLSPTSIAQYSTRLQGNNVQCGMVTNDYSKVKFPDAPRMGDTYESKIATINAIGKAPIPQVWGLFVMDTWTSTGHTGIVTAVNWDGTFTATDANKSGSKDGWPLQTSTYKISDKVSFSNAPTGSATTTWTVDVPAYQKYLNSWTLPTGLKAGTAKANEWLQGYSQWKSTANPLSDSVQKRVDSYSDDYSKNANVVSAFKFAPLLRQYDTVKVSDLSSSQRQGIISDYAKALDPDSVVREWEYATVAKYSSSFGEKTLSEINQFLSGNGTLSDAAAQKVIDAIKSRGKNYVEQEKNVRNQYIEKINRATGYKDWDMQLVYPDYSTPTTQSNSKLSALMQALANIAKNAPKQ